MSYILDALKQAERDREVAHVPTLTTVHSTRPSMPRKQLWILGGACLALAGALAWLAVSRVKPAATLPSSPPHSEVTEHAEPLRESPPVDISSAQPSSTLSHPQTSFLRKSPAVSTSAPPAEIPPVSLLERKPAEAASREAQPPENTPPIPRSLNQPQTGFGSLPPPTAEGTPAAGESPQKPLSLREAIANMNITVLQYSEAKAERMVFINDKKYLEGDYVEGLYLLESITPDGAVLSYQGERAVLRSRAK